MLATLTSNKILDVCAVSWFCAQFIKTVLNLILTKSLQLERMVGAGGMPSAHSAFVTALCVETVQTCGIAEPISAVAIAMAIVVIYDAMGVRRAAGEQAKTINNLIMDLQQNGFVGDAIYENLKELLGHTPLQVARGVTLGRIIALIL